MQKVVDIIKHIKEAKHNVEFLPTGFKALDEFLDGGFMRKELVVIGAYTGVGKSFFAGNIFYNVAKNGYKSAYFSLEISNAMVVSRLVGAIANIKPTRLIAGYLTEQEHTKRIEAEAEVEEYNEFMDLYDEVYNFEKIKEAILEHEYEFVVVDFLQNVVARGSDEYARLSGLALSFQQLAKQTNCCIVLLSQLSNEAARKGYVEYKGSGSIQTVCDLGFFIIRENPDLDLNSNDVKLKLLKNRRGMSGMEFPFTFTQPGGQLHETRQHPTFKN